MRKSFIVTAMVTTLVSLSVNVGAAEPLKASDCAPYVPISGGSPDQLSALPAMNRQVLASVAAMPHSSGDPSKLAGNNVYRTLARSAALDANQTLAVTLPNSTDPANCSQATYIAFLKTIADMQARDRGAVSTDLTSKLLPGASKTDGIGMWGYWNANGGGTAQLFKDTGIGENITNFKDGRPGDFMKIWWKDQIGNNGTDPHNGEQGHSVIFQGCATNKQGKPFLCFWSGNGKGDKDRVSATAQGVFPPQDNSVRGGYSTRCKPLDSIKHFVFSRLENMTGEGNKLKNFADNEKQPELVGFTKFAKTGSTADAYVAGLRYVPSVSSTTDGKLVDTSSTVHTGP